MLAVVILFAPPSVLCDKSKQSTTDILIPHEGATTLVFWHQQWLVGNAPSVFCLKFNLKVTYPVETRQLRQTSAYNISTVRDSEKSSIMPNSNFCVFDENATLIE